MIPNDEKFKLVTIAKSSVKSISIKEKTQFAKTSTEISQGLVLGLVGAGLLILYLSLDDSDEVGF